MRYFIFFSLAIALLSLLACDQMDEEPITWEKTLNLNTGLGVIQNESGEYLFHSHNQIIKFNENGEEIWRINLLEQLTEYSGLSISEIQKNESAGYAVLINGSLNSVDDPGTTVSLLLLDEMGMIQSKSKIFSGNNIQGSFMKVQMNDNGYAFSIIDGNGNNNDKLVAIKAGTSGEVLEEKSCFLNDNNYTVSGATVILKDQKGFLLEAVLKSITGDESTNRRLIKLDTNLSELWSVDFGGPAFNEIHDIIELSTGELLLAGTYLSQGWALKINSVGSIEWDKKYIADVPGQQFFFDATETEMGDIVLTGSNNVNGAGADDLWLVHLNESGDINWEVKHGSSYYDFGRSVIYTRDRGYALSGGIQSGFENPIQMWVLKLNSEGKF